MSFPEQFVRVGGRDFDLVANPIEKPVLRQSVEPWLSALFQSEHLSLLVGNGLPTAVAGCAGVTATSMDPPTFAAPNADKVAARAAVLAESAGRGAPNIEDALRAALQLLGGLDVLGDASASEWRKEVSSALAELSIAVLATEAGIATAVESMADRGSAAATELVSFLLSFASRAASRERLNLFTTNYDRLIEYACDLAGLRPLDRFIGGLTPRFRASRVDIDMHYNPPGIRGEPRYLEGVLRLTKLHGSIDWEYQQGQLRRKAMAFGATVDRDSLAASAFDSLIIYPNPAKDVETLEYPYAELFRDFSAALCRPNATLVTYGYGFGDDHINRVISDMLTIPSTHLVVISYSDTGSRIATFLEGVGRAEQGSLLVGSEVAALSPLVEYFLPKPAIDVVTYRKAELLSRRSTDGTSSAGHGTP